MHQRVGKRRREVFPDPLCPPCDRASRTMIDHPRDRNLESKAELRMVEPALENQSKIGPLVSRTLLPFSRKTDAWKRGWSYEFTSDFLLEANIREYRVFSSRLIKANRGSIFLARVSPY
ncbi:hypothetical protein KM043_005840 [Ampulex compressa]|nr:hypothetical protein KM043_005840 [Ampulex compressa]